MSLEANVKAENNAHTGHFVLGTKYLSLHTGQLGAFPLHNLLNEEGTNHQLQGLREG